MDRRPTSAPCMACRTSASSAWLQPALLMEEMETTARLRTRRAGGVHIAFSIVS